MPFHGILDKRRHLFASAEPRRDVGVSDPEAWRLNPAHRWVYDRLQVALSQGLRAAPVEEDPAAFGFARDEVVFVKPIINLEGMGRGAREARAGDLPADPGSFWSERLEGRHVSSDCLVREGEILWRSDTVASAEHHRHRPLVWRVGHPCPEVDRVLQAWVCTYLPDYTGICNLETIGGQVSEVHLRGSNGFLELYPEGFVAAWAELVDSGRWPGLEPMGEGYVLSLFTDDEGVVDLSGDEARALAPPGVLVDLDLDPERRPSNGRIAVVRTRDRAAGEEALDRLRARLGH